MDNNLDIITLFNPDRESFLIKYDNKSYGVIEPGGERRMPRFLADLAVKHLIDQCINSFNGGDTANAGLREEWSKKIVKSEEANEMIAPKLTPEEKLQKDVDEMNRKTDLAKVLEGRKTTVSEVIPTPPATPPPYHENPQNQIQEAQPSPTPPTGESQVLPDQDSTDTPPAQTETPAKETPTREQLYTYAEKTLGMNLNDEKTKTKLDSMTEQQLTEELNYDPTAA